MSQIDVIVPVYNPNMAWFDQMKESVNAQMLGKSNFKVTLGVAEECNNKAPSYENIYEQIERAYLKTKSPYVIVFGCDDVMNPGFLLELLTIAKKQDAAIVYSNYEMMHENGTFQQHVQLNPRYDFMQNCRLPHYPDVALFSRAAIEECDAGFNTNNGRYVMWSLWLQIGAKYPRAIFHTPYYGFRYRQHEGGMHHKENREERVKFLKGVDEWLQRKKS